MKILISGFKPFLGEKINPSGKLALELQEKFPEVISVILPVEFKTSFYILEREIRNIEPDFVIMLGQSAGREKICFEKIGLNWIETLNADEGGAIPVTGLIEKNEPLAIMSKFPFEEHLKNLKNKKLPVEVSFSAGTFVCNELYFKTLNEFKTLKAVFIHVPLIAEQIDQQTLELKKIFLDYATQLQTLTELLHGMRGY
ncbi:MAG: pyroglutamyl-peptidase I [Pseudobdellovibrio sp.]